MHGHQATLTYSVLVSIQPNLDFNSQKHVNENTEKGHIRFGRICKFHTDGPVSAMMPFMYCDAVASQMPNINFLFMCNTD